MATNDDQAAQLVAALAPLLSKALLPELQKQVEEQVQGIKAKNNELIDALQTMKKDAEIAAQIKDGESIMEKAKRLSQAPKNDKGLTDFRKVGDPVRISRTDARSVDLYRKAKDLAAEQKVPLEIVSED